MDSGRFERQIQTPDFSKRTSLLQGLRDLEIHRPDYLRSRTEDRERSFLSSTSRASHSSKTRQLIEDGLKWRAQQEALAEQRAAAEAEEEDRLHQSVMDDFMALPDDEISIFYAPEVKRESLDRSIIVNQFTTPERIPSRSVKPTTPPESGPEKSRSSRDHSLDVKSEEERDYQQGANFVLSQAASPPESGSESGSNCKKKTNGKGKYKANQQSQMVRQLSSQFVDGNQEDCKGSASSDREARRKQRMTSAKPVPEYPPILPPMSGKRPETHTGPKDSTTPSPLDCSTNQPQAADTANLDQNTRPARHFQSGQRNEPIKSSFILRRVAKRPKTPIQTPKSAKRTCLYQSNSLASASSFSTEDDIPSFSDQQKEARRTQEASKVTNASRNQQRSVMQGDKIQVQSQDTTKGFNVTKVNASTSRKSGLMVPLGRNTSHEKESHTISARESEAEDNDDSTVHIDDDKPHPKSSQTMRALSKTNELSPSPNKSSNCTPKKQKTRSKAAGGDDPDYEDPSFHHNNNSNLDAASNNGLKRPTSKRRFTRSSQKSLQNNSTSDLESRRFLSKLGDAASLVLTEIDEDAQAIYEYNGQNDSEPFSRGESHTLSSPLVRNRKSISEMQPLPSQRDVKGKGKMKATDQVMEDESGTRLSEALAGQSLPKRNASTQPSATMAATVTLPNCTFQPHPYFTSGRTDDGQLASRGFISFGDMRSQYSASSCSSKPNSKKSRGKSFSPNKENLMLTFKLHLRHFFTCAAHREKRPDLYHAAWLFEKNPGFSFKSICSNAAGRNRENSELGTPDSAFEGRGRRIRGAGATGNMWARSAEEDSAENLRGQLKNHRKELGRKRAAATLAEKELDTLKEKLKAAERAENLRR